MAFEIAIMGRAVGIDSNTVTYLLDAMAEQYDPCADKDLRAERVAMVRILFYSDRLLWVGPTVESEYRDIPDSDKRETHRRIVQYVLEDQLLRVAPETLQRRVSELKSFHRGDADCRVVAETEAAGLDTLLSCDRKMLGATWSDVTKVAVLKPSVSWQSLSIPPGSSPRRGPAPGHPLFGKNWWRHDDA